MAIFVGFNALPGKAAELPDWMMGFVDGRGGLRTQSAPYEDDVSLAELRLQLATENYIGPTTLTLRGDFLLDAQADSQKIDLESGNGWLDLREANLLFPAGDLVDMKIGRQILTWGTGDLLFINDMFPKDWNSFFIGRDEEYLKAPSDAVLASYYPTDYASIDLVYNPLFDPDRYIDGSRVSYWSPMLGSTAGQNAVIEPAKQNSWFEDFEVSGRLGLNVDSYELAAYGYYGYWKSPNGYDPELNQAYFPELTVFGGSARGPLGKGIASIEGGSYYSAEDSEGTDPNIPNSELRYLMGYEQEVVQDFSAGVQYYLEWLQDYSEYRSSLPEEADKRDKYRHLFTLRLTWMLMDQNMTLSLFTFYSPSDADGYTRPAATYKLNDDWKLSIGGNYFWGDQPNTFFGQFENNNNLYAAARYSF